MIVRRTDVPTAVAAALVFSDLILIRRFKLGSIASERLRL